MRVVFIILFLLIKTGILPAEPLELRAKAGEWIGKAMTGVDAGAECFAVEVTVDPVVPEGGDFQVVAGLMVGLPDDEADLTNRKNATITVDLREGADRSAFIFWHREKNMTQSMPEPKPAGWVDSREYQHPHVRAIRNGEGHRIRLVVWPEGSGSAVRLFVDQWDRPVEEHILPERITAGTVKLLAVRGGSASEPTKASRFSEFDFETLSEANAKHLPSYAEVVLRAIDYSRPDMAPVGRAIQQGRIEKAKSLFLNHMRNCRKPQGPKWEQILASVLHPEYRTIAEENLAGRYGTVGYFADFADAWTDTDGETHKWVLQEEPLRINWAKDNGHLNRHFHWVALAKAWDETKESRYAKRFSDEVLDWVSREPFFWERCPTVGKLNLMDGTVFRWGYMNTSNIGRRLELTWWPSYEVFRKSPDFSDEAHFAMLVGMIRQARLIMNPTSFAVHDDGAAHTTMGLLQTAMMLPEFKASADWKEMALKRWDEMLAKQFHPDGSHVSLSTGYNWATILSLENFIRFIEQIGGEPPARYFTQLEKALEHPLVLSTPSQTQIPLNDGGWSMVDDHYRRTLHWFPHREDFKWIATKGAEGAPPESLSRYLPNAGQYIMRTGWGEGEKYLFFGAGPWGASHGKQDALNIYVQYGNHLLIRDAGRGSYSGVGNTKHAGQSLSFNTLSPDWAQENSIPHWRTEMHIGFHPPLRRWVDNDAYSYGEGAFNYGWYKPDEHIQGKWLRQVIFVKGEDPKADGYYIVIDTVEPVDDRERTWRHPWQLQHNPPDIAIRETDKSVTAISPGVAMQILPVDPSGEMNLSIIQGQTEPALLGWRIYDTTANPYPVPTYSWKASGTFSRAWVIQMQAKESQWPVASVEPMPSSIPGKLQFKVHRKDGSVDIVLRRFPGSEGITFNAEQFQGDVAVLSRDRWNTIRSKLELDGGLDSVASPSLPAK